MGCSASRREPQLAWRAARDGGARPSCARGRNWTAGRASCQPGIGVSSASISCHDLPVLTKHTVLLPLPLSYHHTVTGRTLHLRCLFCSWQALPPFLVGHVVTASWGYEHWSTRQHAGEDRIIRTSQQRSEPGGWALVLCVFASLVWPLSRVLPTCAGRGGACSSDQKVDPPLDATRRGGGSTSAARCSTLGTCTNTSSCKYPPKRASHCACQLARKRRQEMSHRRNWCCGTIG